MKHVKKILALILILTLNIVLLPLNIFNIKTYAASTMKVGDYVQFGSYLGKPIMWRVINVDNSGSPMLYAENILTFKPFDAAESGYYKAYDETSDFDRQAYGSNKWSNSNLREWLNSDETKVTYSTQAPVKTAVENGYNYYSDEAGFLSNFTMAEEGLIKPITHKSILSDTDKDCSNGGYEDYKYNSNFSLSVANYDNSYYQNVEDRVYILDVKELHDYVYNRGYEYRKMPTQEAVEQCSYKNSSINANSFWNNYLRMPKADDSYSTLGVLSDGTINCGVSASLCGVTPAINLKSCSTYSGLGTKNNPYMLAAAAPRYRVAGNNRYETSVQISRAGWKTTCDTVVIATGEDFPDALCAAPLAKKYNAPILLTDSAFLNSNAELELKRLKPKNIYIIGGIGAVSQNTENSIKSLYPGINAIRIAGINRYDTSKKIAENIGTASNIVLATGNNFPDALSIAPIAAMKRMPILLTDSNELPLEIKDYIDKNKASIVNTYIVGGTGAVSGTIEKMMKNPLRLSGSNRYSTNISILNQFKNDLNFSNIYVATGTNFPDALSCSALAPLTNSPIVLADAGSLTDAQTFLNSNIDKINSITGVGGTGVIPNSVLNDILNK